MSDNNTVHYMDLRMAQEYGVLLLIFEKNNRLLLPFNGVCIQQGELVYIRNFAVKNKIKIIKEIDTTR